MTDNRSTIRIAAEQLASLAFMLAAFAIVTVEGWWRKEGKDGRNQAGTRAISIPTPGRHRGRGRSDHTRHRESGEGGADG